jgi:hypothetical protein
MDLKTEWEGKFHETPLNLMSCSYGGTGILYNEELHLAMLLKHKCILICYPVTPLMLQMQDDVIKTSGNEKMQGNITLAALANSR